MLRKRLYELHFGPAQVASRDSVRMRLAEASKSVEANKFSLHFLLSEWEQIVDAWQINTWESYRDVVRLGRKTRLPENERLALWSIFERVLTGLSEANFVTQAYIFSRLARKVFEDERYPFDFAVIDEAQDVSIAQLRFLGALGAKRRNALFFAGDLGQRIFQPAFSWKALGVDVRGRSATLKVNYRTSHHRLLGPEVPTVPTATTVPVRLSSSRNGASGPLP